MSDFKIDPTGAIARKSMGKVPMMLQNSAIVLDDETSDSNCKPKN
jgi:hypothetical protein